MKTEPLRYACSVMLLYTSTSHCPTCNVEQIETRRVIWGGPGREAPAFVKKECIPRLASLRVLLTTR
jgi:hypothetical protein